MIRVNHFTAIKLESLVRKVYNCDRYGVVGLANADFLERMPLAAAIAVLSPLSFRYSDEQLADLSEFWDKYRMTFSLDNLELSKEEISTIIEEYVNDLSVLVDKYY